MRMAACCGAGDCYRCLWTTLLPISWTAHALPRLDAARMEPEQRMRFRLLQRTPLPIMSGAPGGELSKQVLPFMLQLSLRYGNWRYGAYRADPGAVKGVTAPCCFGVHGTQIRRDRIAWRGMSLKASKLRVMAVTLGHSPQYGPGQKRFSPECNQTLRIQVPRVQGPQSHWSLNATAKEPRLM